MFLKRIFKQLRISTLILYQNLTSGSFLNVSWNMDSETLPMNYSYPVHVKTIGQSYTLNGSSIQSTQAGFCNIMYWSFGKYCFTELCRFSNVGTFIMQCQKFTRLDIIIILSEKSVLSTGKLSRSWRQTQVFQTLNLHLKAWILPQSTNAISGFPWSDRLAQFVFEKMTAQDQIWTTTVFCWSSFQVKMVIH